MRLSITRMTMTHDTDTQLALPDSPVGERGFRAIRAYAWCFTLNNFRDEEVKRFESLECERIVVGIEKAPTTGTPHLQGYVRFKKACRGAWWKTHFPRASASPRRETETVAANYCKKDNAVIIDRGLNYDDVKSDTGKRSRDETATAVLDDIEAGLGFGVLRQKYRLFCFWNRRLVLATLWDHRRYKKDPDAPDPEA